MHVIGNVDRNAMLGERYGIDFDLIPNIAMDIAVPWLARTMPLDLAGRVLLGACLVFTLLSVAFLHRTLFNQWSSTPLLAGLIVYHGSFMAGMVNFSLGIGLVPAALAVWIRLQRARTAWRLLIGSLMTLGLYLCHLVAVGAYGLLVIGYALAITRDDGDHAAGRRPLFAELATAAATGLLPLVLFLRIALGQDAEGAPAGIVYGGVVWKLKALLSPLANYSLTLDLASFALITGLALIAARSGRLALDRRMVPGLLLLALAFVLAPKALWTGGVFDQRLAVLLALMLIASTRFSAPPTSWWQAASILLALLFVLRIGVLTSTWLDHRQDLAEMRRAIGLIEPGARLLVVRPDLKTAQRRAPERHRVFHHAVQLRSLPMLALTERSAFVSTIYALPGQQPLTLKPPYDRLGGRGHADLPTLEDLAAALAPGADPATVSEQIRHWPSDFDYVLMLYGYGQGLDARTAGLPLKPLLDGRILELFRIVER
ncbi:MAG: hypothetical protein R3F54_05630 [Alphaproteobacteria bacterium]